MYIHTGKGSRITSALLECRGVYKPNQVGSQITKLFHRLPQFCELFPPVKHTFATRFWSFDCFCFEAGSHVAQASLRPVR